MKSILIIPGVFRGIKKDCYGLLEPGACGNVVPGAVRHPASFEKHALCMDCDSRGDDHRSEDATSHCSWCLEDWPCGKSDVEHHPEFWTLSGSDAWNKPDALVLMWEGRVVVEGCDRVKRILGKLLHNTYSVEEAEALAQRYVEVFGGKVVVLS